MTTGWGCCLEFTTESIKQLSPVCFITLKRPIVKVSTIESVVRSHYAEDIAKWLFTKELEKQMKKEIERDIKKAYLNNLKLPIPTIFSCRVVESRYSWESTFLKVSVSKWVAMYCIENESELKEMEFYLEKYPLYVEWYWRAKEVFKSIQDFLDKNPHAHEIEDSFTQEVKEFNSEATNLKNKVLYKRYEPKWDIDVITKVDEDWNINWQKCSIEELTKELQDKSAN